MCLRAPKRAHSGAGRVFIPLLLALVARSQTVTPTGAILGTVLDPTGAVVSNTKVFARNTDSGVSRSAGTDSSGQFYFSGLPPGTYTLRLDREGFTPLEVKPFLVSIGQVVVHRLTLQLAGVAGKVEVAEQADAVESAATSSSAALGYARIEEAPAKGRNYLNFVSLVPGLVPSSGSGAQRSMTGIRNPYADSGFSFGGLRGRNNSISIDGVDNRDETTGGNRVAIGLEMVQEFRVAGVAVSAEFGGAAGGMVNVVTRTGENRWHGDVTLFLQHEALNAKKPEVEGKLRPRFRRHQPGTSLSGPVRKDRTFFSAAIEHERESGEEWSETPGDAASVINRILSGSLYPGIPVRSVLSGLFKTGQRGTEFSGKVNHQTGLNDTFTLRYAFSRGRVLNDVQGVENFQDRSASGGSLTTDHSLVGSWLRVVSPTTVNALRLQVANRGQQIRPNSRGPLLEIPGVVSFGQAFRLNADRTEKHYELVESLNFSLGSHRVSAGVSCHAVQLHARLANRIGGIYVFPTLPDFEQGRPDVFIQAFGDPGTEMATLPVGLWFQNRWEIKPGFTLEAGLRYDRQWMPEGLPSSTNNVSPRLGLAWKPSVNVPFVVRGGFGLFYDRYPLAYLNEAVQKDGAHGFEQHVVGEDARQIFSLTEGGSLPGPLQALGRSVYRASSYFPSTYSRKISFGLERGLGKNATLTFEANHVRGFHMPRIRSVSRTMPFTYLLEQTGRSAFKGASVSVNRRFNKGMTFLIAYDVGRAEDDGSDFEEQPMDPMLVRNDWAKSRQYQLHRVAASGVFELPTEDLPWPRARRVLKDVTISPTFTAGTGRAINALLTTDAYRTGAYPMTARPLGMPRNPYLSPSVVSLDMRLMKTIRLKRERTWLQFGAEGFNLSNHFNALKVSEYYSAEGKRLSSYGRSIESGNSRQIQLFMQFEF